MAKVSRAGRGPKGINEMEDRQVEELKCPCGYKCGKAAKCLNSTCLLLLLYLFRVLNSLLAVLIKP